ncbi:MAG: hypothetical protein WBR29_03105 [Gammaproteobacteria bacterium]
MPTTNPAVTKYTPPAALHPAITATGTKGFLIWMKSDPVMSQVYRQVQPQLNQLLGVKAGLSGRKQALGAMGCCFCFCGGGGYCDSGSYSCNSCSYCSIASSDSTIAAAPQDSVGSSGLSTSLSNIISTGAALAGTAAQVAAANAMTTAQLQQAAAGARPLALGGTRTTGSLSSLMSGTILGIPTWLVLGGGILAVILVSKK